MTRTLIEAAVCLADRLAQENQALRALNLAGAAAMFDAKRLALEAFAAAQETARPDAPSTQAARDVADRLRVLAEENRALLERGIMVQGRVLATLARAARPAVSGYGARGGPAFDESRTAIALSARA